MRRGRRIAVLAVVCLLAGCGGLTDGGPPASDGDRFTPAPVASPPGPAAPGVHAGGVDAETLVTAHSRSLVNRSYTVRETVDPRNASADRYRSRTRRQAAAGGAPFLVETTYPDRAGSGLRAEAVWYDGDRAVYWRAYGGSAGAELATTVRPAVDPLRRATLEALFAGLRRPTVEARGDGGAVVSGPVAAEAVRVGPAERRAATDASATASVAPSGRVERLALSFSVRVEDEPVRVRYEYRLTDVGRTAVERPAWAGD